MNAEEQGNAAFDFYREALNILNETEFPFMVGGAFSLFHYTDIYRDTKDLDIFCKPADYVRILKHFADCGYRTEITDARWLGKAFKGEYFVDFIFNTPNNICTVDETWFEHATEGEVHGVKTRLLGPEELIWCKIYVQNRERYDGADVNHVLLRYGKQLNWEWLWKRMEPHWQLLLGQFLNFQFVYPGERDIIPRWLFDELLLRAREQFDLPASLEKVCRGTIIDQTQYGTDVLEWKYKSMTMRTV